MRNSFPTRRSADLYVVPALEIIDARSHQIDPDRKRPRKVFGTIADNAANAGVVQGGRPVRIHEVDLRWVGAILSRTEVRSEEHTSELKSLKRIPYAVFCLTKKTIKAPQKNT